MAGNLNVSAGITASATISRVDNWPRVCRQQNQTNKNVTNQEKKIVIIFVVENIVSYCVLFWEGGGALIPRVLGDRAREMAAVSCFLRVIHPAAHLHNSTGEEAADLNKFYSSWAFRSNCKDSAWWHRFHISFSFPYTRRWEWIRWIITFTAD